MKTYSLLVLAFFLYTNFAEAQLPTYAGLPDSTQVLVVYNSLSDSSRAVMNYYKNARGIPDINIVPLDELENKTISYEGVDHLVVIDDYPHQFELIKDKTNEFPGSSTPTIHAWIYFNDYIVKPIRSALITRFVNGVPLKDIIRYIVICQDVPFKLQTTADWANPTDNGIVLSTGIDGLLTFISKSFANPDYFITDFTTYKTFSNPYFNADECYSLEYRFLPYHFVNGLDTLSYLVSRLAGPSYSDIIGMIDRSTHPTMSGNGSWVIDNCLSAVGDDDMIKSNELLRSIDLTVRYDSTNYSIIIPSSDSVMCYTSPGTHHPGFNSDYLRHLNFNYQNGAVINTFESFNGNSLQYPDVRRASQGLIAEFIMTGGTGGIAHAYEPGVIVADSIFFPAYSLGYNFVDAAYLGMSWVGRQNIVIGDPLLRIRDFCADTLTTDEIITSSNIECAIYVPPGRTLTIASGSNINFIKNAHLKVDGNLIIEENSTVNFYGFSCFIVNNSLIVAANSSLNFLDFNRAIISGIFI
ncbi:MAG TPA: hypothetical protein DHV28_05685 [Ignavibacteriales bacterium]|nr:hypothetical protein [Ignavibacteriales bacterium]